MLLEPVALAQVACLAKRLKIPQDGLPALADGDDVVDVEADAVRQGGRPAPLASRVVLREDLVAQAGAQAFRSC
jgi:hypothetical protein